MQEFKDLMSLLTAISMLLLVYIINWLMTCGISYLFCWLIGWNFDWKTAIIVLIVSLFL